MRYVYLLKNEKESIYKLGISKHPNKRVKELQTGSSSKIILVNSYLSKYYNEIETALHNTYHIERESGEWFNLSLKEEQSFIDECKKIEKNYQFLNDNKVSDTFEI